MVGDGIDWKSRYIALLHLLQELCLVMQLDHRNMISRPAYQQRLDDVRKKIDRFIASQTEGGKPTCSYQS